jgi:cell division protein FtsQ
MKKWGKRIAWIILGIFTIILLLITKQWQAEKTINKPQIIVHVQGENAFLTEDELYTRLKRKGFIFNGQINQQLNTTAVEQHISAMTEVREVHVFTQLGGNWQIDVTVRNPIARIFNKYHQTFYLDDQGTIMNTSTLHTARVVVVTGAIPDQNTSPTVPTIINNDTLKSIHKLDDIYRISHYVCNDPLFRALIGQIHLKKNGDFVLIPLIGGQKIIFGTAANTTEVSEKFKKLKVFYNEAIPYEGWNKYEEISLKYKNQIVCRTIDGYTE